MRVVVFAFPFVLSFIVCMPQDRSALCLFLLRFLSLLSFACCVFAQFLCCASLRNSFADRSNVILSGCVRHGFFLFCPLRIHFYIRMYMLTRIRAASGLIISCIQPPGFAGVPFMVGMLFFIHSDIHVGMRTQGFS